MQGGEPLVVPISIMHLGRSGCHYANNAPPDMLAKSTALMQYLYSRICPTTMFYTHIIALQQCFILIYFAYDKFYSHRFDLQQRLILTEFAYDSVLYPQSLPTTAFYTHRFGLRQCFIITDLTYDTVLYSQIWPKQRFILTDLTYDNVLNSQI
jgi:hypothetical protein